MCLRSFCSSSSSSNIGDRASKKMRPEICSKFDGKSEEAKVLLRPEEVYETNRTIRYTST